MSGIPVYTQSPINASKATGTTPQTAAPQGQTSPSAPKPAPAQTTTSSTSSYPPARPGATVPAPTTAAQRYVPHQPTPTTHGQAKEGPPPPQPGAVPIPPHRNQIPPPPKAGESYHAPQQTAAPASGVRQHPPQMSIPAPSNTYGAQPPHSSTSTTNTASASYPVAIPAAEYEGPRRSLEHPPGYQQNTYASEPTSDQRRAQEANGSSGVMAGSEGGLDADSVWNVAKKWAQTAGEKISEAEAEVWRKINKE
jgi:hypothetical protein